MQGNPTKQCRVCGENLPFEDFYHFRNKNGRLYPNSYCKPCSKKKRREYGQKPDSKETIRRRHLKRSYGLSTHQFQAMLEAQGGVCAICKQPESYGSCQKDGIRRLSVDHFHSSGKIRSLLCAACNKAVGLFKDDPQLLRAAADYLDRHAQG